MRTKPGLATSGRAIPVWACNTFRSRPLGRLLAPAGIDLPPDMPLPAKLEQVQKLMAEGDGRARRIYEAIGAYLGYTIAHFADFYEFRNLLVLGRVMTGEGGDLTSPRLRNAWARRLLSDWQIAPILQIHSGQVSW
jgi:predicted NBD/HSP70 family sugar kinase